MFISPLISSGVSPLNSLEAFSKITFHQLQCRYFSVSNHPSHWKRGVKTAYTESTSATGEKEVEYDKKVELKWTSVGTDISEELKQSISKLPPTMSNRCKALMKRIICFSPDDENLHCLLAAWVKFMKPERADWLSVLKELQRRQHPLLMEVMEYALVESSFEANIRDYTKLIDLYGKQNLLEEVENSFFAMKRRGFPCDQVTYTVLVHTYSKAGYLNRAKEAFDEIKLLGLPLDRRAYGSMVMAYIRAGMLNSAEILIKEMEEQELYAGKEVYKAMLRAYSNIGNADGAQRVFDSIQYAGIVPDSKLCALLINAYRIAGHSDKAHSVLENMRSCGLKPSDKCIALILSAYEEEKNLERAVAFLMELEGDDIVIGEEASRILARWFQKLGVAGEVEQVLREFTSKKSDKAASFVSF